MPVYLHGWFYQLLPQNTTTSKREARRWWMNADVNGAINIARKELGDDWLKELVGLYRGCLVNTPVVLNTTRKSPLQTALTLSGCVAMEIEAATSIGGR